MAAAMDGEIMRPGERGVQNRITQSAQAQTTRPGFQNRGHVECSACVSDSRYKTSTEFS